MEFHDTHAHLTWKDFEGEIDAIISRARDAGISKIISIGTNIESSRRAIQIAEAHDGVFAAIGWHPGDAEEAPADFCAELRELAVHPKVVAIGETGLDHYRLPTKSGGTPEQDAAIKKRQVEVFEEQLNLAAELKLNCVIHTRESFADTIGIVRRYAGKVRTVFHCFVEDTQSMRAVLETGGLVSFTGICTFKNAQLIRDTIAATPLHCLMLETDSPFLAPVPYRGKRCEPAYVKEISEAVAQIKKCTLAELSHTTCATAREFFRKL
ncbi:MAG TPA: TatD family hydrolase [Verrucomicrobiae bacterium]|nr:TatD family hydrolase [Verrucomicrobiae bacterium]